jgi:hypothetical protein
MSNFQPPPLGYVGLAAGPGLVVGVTSLVAQVGPLRLDERTNPPLFAAALFFVLTIFIVFSYREPPRHDAERAPLTASWGAFKIKFDGGWGGLKRQGDPHATQIRRNYLFVKHVRRQRHHEYPPTLTPTDPPPSRVRGRIHAAVRGALRVGVV